MSLPLDICLSLVKNNNVLIGLGNMTVRVKNGFQVTCPIIMTCFRHILNDLFKSEFYTSLKVKQNKYSQNMMQLTTIALSTYTTPSEHILSKKKKKKTCSFVWNLQIGSSCTRKILRLHRSLK
jgi:hypothetical protein